MSSVAFLRSERTETRAETRNGTAEPDRSLGPAVVTRLHPHEVEVRLKSGRVVRAQPALAFTYAPAEGDVVLVIGDDEAHYVIGVLHGTGRAVLEVQGDIDVRAVGGVLRLTGDKGVEVASPDVSLRARRLEVVAGAVVERFTSLCKRVTELFSVQAGQSHTVVEGSSFAQSKSATVVTQEKMTLNGKAIYLG